jgi:hypothetical protein
MRRFPASLSRSSLAFLLSGVLVSGPAASSPYCRGRHGVAPIPTELQAQVAAAFNIATQSARDAVLRCDGTTLLACAVGANLNCDKADRRRSLPGASAYCRANPDSKFIPMFVTGHATIYQWRCEGRRAIAGKAVVTVDPQGYAAENWKAIR